MSYSNLGGTSKDKGTVEHAGAGPDAPVSLRGKGVLITGASSGVGLAAARAFSAEGAQVALIARRVELVESLAAELGDAAIAFPADVRDSDAIAEAVALADRTFGGLELVVNAAGVGFPCPLEDVTAEVWREVIGVNVSGTFSVAREAGLRMRDAGSGSIVNIGSELSSIGMAPYSAYCASKFAVIGMTKALAAELAPQVRVNVVCPGPIDTPMMDAELEWYPDPAEARRGAVERVPLKRFATPQEVVRAIRFIGVEARYATGSVLSLDGGTTIG